MQHLHAIGEDEMVAVFLQTEVASTRFAPTILAILRRDGRERRIIDQPDLSNATGNATIGTHVQEVVFGVLHPLLDHEQTLAALTSLVVEEPVAAHHRSNLTFTMERPSRLSQLARIMGHDGPKVQFRYEHG